MIREHIDFTTENGKVVFTSFFLWNRGFCCGSGCRHCPYREAMTEKEVWDELETRIRSEHKGEAGDRLISLALTS